MQLNHKGSIIILQLLHCGSWQSFIESYGGQRKEQSFVCWGRKGFCWCSLQLLNIAFRYYCETSGQGIEHWSCGIWQHYQSVVNLDEQYLWTSKDMLLRQRNSMEHYCQETLFLSFQTVIFGFPNSIIYRNCY